MKCSPLLAVCGVLLLHPILANATHSPVSQELSETLENLELSMGKIQTLHAAFEQEKKLKMFNHPIVLLGEFYMQKPDRFAWHTQSPVKNSVVMNQEEIISWNEDTQRIEKISLKKLPVLKSVVEQIRLWFSGSYASLSGDYEIDRVSARPLTLSFKPTQTSRDEGLIDHVFVRFNESKTAIDSLEIVDRKGDESRFTFKNVVLNAPIDPLAWEIPRND